MFFDTSGPQTNWDIMPQTPQQTQNSTNFANFHSRINQQQQPLQRLPAHFQKNERSTRRYSSGTPTHLQNDYAMQSTHSINGIGRKSGNKGTFRSATFHQPNNTFSPVYRLPQQKGQQGGQLRTSSSFHGCIQQGAYNGSNSYSGTQQPKSSMYTVTGSFHPGMKDVPMWLKSLRLHKYTRLFQEMSYDEMMALDDQKLEQRQVTKGARKKILQSLDKLRDRSQLIRQLEKCIDEHGDVRCLIVELRAMMHTPIAAYRPTEDPKPSNYLIDGIGIAASEVSDDNLPGHIARLCIRLHEFLFRNGLPKIQELGIEDEYLLKLLQVYDKILSNEAFTYRQRYCIYECKRVISRYMLEQKILGQTLLSHGQQAQSQPLLVSSPSSGYHTMSPPSSSTRRNSDTKEEIVDDLTATTTATNSDDDFHVSNSAPASPPNAFLNSRQQYQTQPAVRQSPEQWSTQKYLPGLDWSNSSHQQNRASTQQVSNSVHFQPYVNDQFVGIGSINQPRQAGWYPESNPIGYQRVMDAKEHGLSDLYRNNSVKPPKVPSPIGSRPYGGDATLPLALSQRLEYLVKEKDGPEILDLALQFAMKVKSQKNQESQQTPLLWQNIREQPTQKRQAAPVPQASNWWTNSIKQSGKPSTPLYSAIDFNKKPDFYGPWSQQPELSLSDQLTTSTTSSATTNDSKSSQLDANLLNRMLNDTHICGGQSQQQQRIMRQYTLPDDLTPTESRLFSGITRSDDLRALLNDHPTETPLFAPFHHLPCSASGAVH